MNTARETDSSFESTFQAKPLEGALNVSLVLLHTREEQGNISVHLDGTDTLSLTRGNIVCLIDLTDFIRDTLNCTKCDRPPVATRHSASYNSYSYLIFAK